MADIKEDKIVKPLEESDAAKKSVELDEKDLQDVSGGAGVLINKVNP